MKRLSILFLFFLSFSLSAQENDTIDEYLVKEFKSYFYSDKDDKYNFLSEQLKAKVDSIFSTNESLEYTLDSLSKLISIVQSQDKKLRLISWDEMTGGTWHDMAVFVQYLDDNSQVQTAFLDSDISGDENGMIDDILYEMHEYTYKGNRYYLCFGWGTYGSGHHHRSIQVFTIKNGIFKECLDCIDGAYSFIQSARSDKIHLSHKKGKIEYNNFVRNEDTGFMEPAEGTTVLIRKGKQFIKSTP